MYTPIMKIDHLTRTTIHRPEGMDELEPPTVRVWSSVSHRKQPALLVTHTEVLVVETGAVDRFTTSAVAASKIAALQVLDVVQPPRSAASNVVRAQSSVKLLPRLQTYLRHEARNNAMELAILKVKLKPADTACALFARAECSEVLSCAWCYVRKKFKGNSARRAVPKGHIHVHSRSLHFDTIHGTLLIPMVATRGYAATLPRC